MRLKKTEDGYAGRIGAYSFTVLMRTPPARGRGRGRPWRVLTRVAAKKRGFLDYCETKAEAVAKCLRIYLYRMLDGVLAKDARVVGEGRELLEGAMRWDAGAIRLLCDWLKDNGIRWVDQVIEPAIAAGVRAWPAGWDAVAAAYPRRGGARKAVTP